MEPQTRSQGEGLLIGYARVSTADQSLDLQLDELRRAGCDPERIYTDVASGARDDRPGLKLTLEVLRRGDTLVVWKLDRLGRSLRHLIETVAGLEQRGVGLRVLREAIDTTTPGGRLFFHMIGALAEFERDLIRERTMAGLVAARARGRNGGRPKVLSASKLAQARALMADKSISIKEICETLGVSKTTLYRNAR